MLSSSHTNLRVGQSPFLFEPQAGWLQRPAGLTWLEVAAVATDSRDRVFVFNRGEHPVAVFNRDGTFLYSWGEGLFGRPHGITIGPDDSVYCTDDFGHTVRKFNPDGRMLLTLGTPANPPTPAPPVSTFGPSGVSDRRFIIQPTSHCHPTATYTFQTATVTRAFTSSPLMVGCYFHGVSREVDRVSFAFLMESLSIDTGPSTLQIARTVASSTSRLTENLSRNGPTLLARAKSFSMPQETSSSRRWDIEPACGRGSCHRPRIPPADE